MKKLFKVLSLFIGLGIFGCNNDSTSPPETTIVTGTYFPLTAGSTWKYQTDSNTYVLEVGPSTSIDGRVYTKLSPSTDTSSGGLFSNDSNATYTIGSDATGLALHEMVFFKQEKTDWSYEVILLGVSTKTIGETLEGGLSRTVLGESYSNVLHMRQTVTVAIGEFSSTSIVDYYFAKDIGMIETLTDGVATDRLIEYDVK